MLLLLLFACAPAPTHEASMSGPTHALKVSLASAGGTRVTMTVANPTDAGMRFCRYHTPFEGVRNNIFRVRSGGEELRYLGKMAKRAPPGPEDFLLIAPGASLEATVDLRPSWKMTSGDWSVQYRGTDISGLGDSNTIEVQVP